VTANSEVTQLRAALVQCVRASVEANQLLAAVPRPGVLANNEEAKSYWEHTILRARQFLQAGIEAANKTLEAGAVP